MRKLCLLLSAFALLSISGHAYGEKRFGREVIKVADPANYSLFKLDDVTYASLEHNGIAVCALVYRGTENYYVEIGITNKSDQQITVPSNFVSFDKPQYTVIRTDTMAVANQLATAANARFIPTPPPYVPPSSTTTTYNGTATTYSNQTQVNGTATTTVDNSGQAGANFGNALGNAIAARRFRKAQSETVSLSTFLSTFAQPSQPFIIAPDETRVIACTFDQLKHKKAPFEIKIRLSDKDFDFKYKE